MAEDLHGDKACQGDISSAQARSSDPASSLKGSVSKDADISSGMVSPRRTASGKILYSSTKIQILHASKKIQRRRIAFEGDISSARARISDPASSLKLSVSKDADISTSMISARCMPSGKILPASEMMQRIRRAERMTEMTESSHGSAESKEERLQYTTGIAISERLFYHCFDRSSLRDLLKRCEILSSEEDFGPFVGIPGLPSINELATLVADRKLTNGLCCPILPSALAHSIKSLLRHHQDMKILLVNWCLYVPYILEQTRALQISFGHSSEGEPGHHIKISLGYGRTRLTEDDHVSIFRSIVMPVAEEFKPDMVFFNLSQQLPPSMQCTISCTGHLIGMLMKIADGKVVVWEDSHNPNIVEVLLRSLLSDNKDSLPGRSHPTAEGSKIIERTVKKYGEHWKCLREGNSPASMTRDKYSALKETGEQFEATSKTAPSIFTRKSEMTECSPGSAESKEKRLCTTGIVSSKWAFGICNRPPLSELLKRCEILSWKEDSGPFVDHTSINELATLVAEGKLSNGLCLTFPYTLEHSIQSLLHHHQDMNILLVDWNHYVPHSFKQTSRLLQISLESELNLRNILEREPGYHIKIFLGNDWTELTEDDHVSIFQSIVMPVAEEFMPDMVFFIPNQQIQLSMSQHKSCIGHLIGMLMKLADGKVICNYYNPSHTIEVLLRTLLSDNKDSMPGLNHPTAKGSRIIKRTVKEYREHWKCLRERYSLARMTEDKYSALKETEKEVETTSETVSKSLQRPSTQGSAEKQMRDLYSMDVNLPSTSYERIAIKREDVKPFSLQGTGSTESEAEDEDCEISLDVPCSSRYIYALTSYKLTDPSFGLGGLCKEFKYFSFSAERQKRESVNEVTAADDDDGGEKNQDQINMILTSTAHGIKQEDVKVSRLQSTDSEADEGCETSPDLPCSSRHTAQTLYKLADPSVESGELGEEFNDFLAQDVGIEGGNIELHSHEIHFPENAVDETIHTKFSISLETDLDLPSNLVPISHVLYCSPGKKIFNKHVTVKMPVWFKLASIAQPVNIHVYSCHEGQPWEREGTVALKTAEAISFHCLHFCKKVIVMEADDIVNGEFSIDYFLCMNKTGNFLSCHCVSTIFMVKELVERFKESGYRIIHPAVSRITEALGSKISVSLVSQRPDCYKVQPDVGYNLTISENFYRRDKYESFSFTLSFVTESRPPTFSLMYNIGKKSFAICERTSDVDFLPTGQEPRGTNADPQSLVHVELHGVQVGDKIKEINANTLATRHATVNLDQDDCAYYVSSKTENQSHSKLAKVPPDDELHDKIESNATRSKDVKRKTRRRKY